MQGFSPESEEYIFFRHSVKDTLRRAYRSSLTECLQKIRKSIKGEKSIRDWVWLSHRNDGSVSAGLVAHFKTESWLRHTVICTSVQFVTNGKFANKKMLTAFSKRCMQTKHILKISSKNKIAFFYTCMGNEHKKGQKK